MTQPALRLTPPVDADLIDRSLLHPEAFAAIFDRHFRAIHRYLARRVGSDRADDLAAAVFTVAFERRGRFSDQFGTALPWLYGIATNLLRNERRQEQRMLERIASLSEEQRLRAVTSDADSEREQQVAAALARLHPGRRDVLLLYAWAELSYDEIAEALEIPVGTVRSRLARARSDMRAALTDDPKERR
jgi:RNA polymerase sigma factor (sigma-70 family)